MQASTHVTFIGATGRSGSTLVGRTLGSAPGFCHVGELCWIWNYGLLHNRPCGCGSLLRECPFWTAVGDAGFGGWERVDASELNTLRRSLVRTTMVRRLWPAVPAGRHAASIARYREVMGRLYAAIADVSGADVVVDSSKQAAAALLARSAPGVEVRLIHLVRSPLGVAYSWTKHVSRADLGGQEMRRRRAWRTALRWRADVALFERLGRTTPRLPVRYEDFVTAADSTTAAMVEFAASPSAAGPAGPGHAGRVAAALDFAGPSWVELAPDHSVWGNPMRNDRGRATLKLDDTWRSELPASQRRIVSVLTWPTAARLGLPSE